MRSHRILAGSVAVAVSAVVATSFPRLAFADATTAPKLRLSLYEGAEPWLTPVRSATILQEAVTAGLVLLALALALAAVHLAWRLGHVASALAAAETRFVQLAEQSSDVVLRLRGGARSSSTSVVDLLGYSAEEMAEIDWASLIHPDDLAQVSEARHGLSNGASCALDYRLLHRGGHIVHVEAAVCRLDAGGVEEIFVTLRDVTARHEEHERLRRAMETAREAEATAAEASRAKGDFLAAMSHEIRTPLNAIIGFADLIITDRSLGPAARQHAERVKAGGDALLTVVNDILDFSQVEAGALRLDPQPFALPLLVDECVALVESAARARNLSLHVTVDEQVPAGVIGDEARLRQILLNLVNNAIKFTHSGAVTLRIRGAVDGGERVLFEVEDTGIGIAAADLPQLFKRFRQVDGTIRRNYGGTGLGLAISKMLVEAMGGTIGVRSVPGNGSTFWFALDLPATRLKLEMAQATGPADPVRPLNILLVEDVRLNQELVLAILEARGHRVDVVGDGAEAIMAIDHVGYDLVLMDVQMPHVDGLTATRAARRLPHAGRLVPIVGLSANVLRSQAAAALASGMDDFLEKPLNLHAIDALLARVAAAEVERVSDADVQESVVAAKLADIVGEAKVCAMFAALQGTLVTRFALPLSPDTTPALKAEAHAAIAGSAMLGFKPFAALCRRFIDAESQADLAKLHDELLRELGRVVRRAGKLSRGVVSARCAA